VVIAVNYVQQYLAIGEAPDVTQQAFQQRSRWSKGHFQVFWSRECPLFDKRLNLFYRLSYSSTCVSYLSTGLSVIVLNVVPVLTILIGWFPITLNFYTVVGITAYYGALNALSYYCLSWSHYKVRRAGAVTQSCLLNYSAMHIEVHSVVLIRTPQLFHAMYPVLGSFLLLLLLLVQGCAFV
jgi:cellulose synthase/poly-beta-1,6-N-acetylglucosamine synthase-like glycosyltransferase